MQSIANQKLAKSFFQHFKVIYPDVRSLIVGDSVEMNPHYFLTLFSDLNINYQFDSICFLKLSFYTTSLAGAENK